LDANRFVTVTNVGPRQPFLHRRAQGFCPGSIRRVSWRQ